MVSRRRFIGALIGSGGLCGSDRARRLLATPTLPASSNLSLSQRHRNASLINRAALVKRHSPTVRKLDPLSPLSVGNGEFAFTADITGLQTFPQEYETKMPLCTMSQWGWHTTPLPSGLDPKALRLSQYDTHGRLVGYQTSAEGQSELFNWLRENPHRLNLARIALQLPASANGAASTSDITDPEQHLDLWSGILTSAFRYQGEMIKVSTAVHPELDLLAVAIESPLLRTGRLGVLFSFPYGSPEMQAADWTKPDRHQTTVINQTPSGAQLHRTLNADEYYLAIAWAGDATFSAEGAHSFKLTRSVSRKTPDTSALDFVVRFSSQRESVNLPPATETFAASERHWRSFWTEGAAIEVAGSKDARAEELERRVVLSQYLTAIQCSGSTPPQETGLTVNSWYGKFHLEMHFWHAAHFALWDRLPLLEKSLAWYQQILPGARDRARSQGYAGARWPKMVGRQGRDSPSPIGPLLIWQQPHPIFYSELCYLLHRNRETLARYADIVFESANFMASYAFFDSSQDRFVLGPPVIPAQENHPPRETWNPTFELAYWHYGLATAQRWRERLGLKRNSVWDQVLAKLSSLPVRDGVYLAHENCPQTYTERNRDHPSMLAALGVLTGEGVERETMRRTLHTVMKDWRWDETWGWDYAVTALTAARLGEPQLALDALLLTTEKNRYLANGHNWQRENLPCYLPGNGALLYAVALLAGGWRGATAGHAPGFPADGSWTVRWEQRNPELLRAL
jgi:protein-glucosylgalactosylhydroxylysine glucosidase